MLWLSRFRLVAGANRSAFTKLADDRRPAVAQLLAQDRVMKVSAIPAAFYRFDDLLRLAATRPN